MLERSESLINSSKVIRKETITTAILQDAWKAWSGTSFLNSPIGIGTLCLDVSSTDSPSDLSTGTIRTFLTGLMLVPSESCETIFLRRLTRRDGLCFTRRYLYSDRTRVCAFGAIYE